MNIILLSYLNLLGLISVATGLNCIICSTATNYACEDSFKGDTSLSSSLTQAGYVSCHKTVYWLNDGTSTYTNRMNLIVRGGSHAICSASQTTGSFGTVYCCSNKDNCNDATIQRAFVFITVSLLIASWVVKRILLY
ncbi:unnamed protein product [Rotaria magnacalcarata]|uniref:Uncharacterized protein n=1 Tax=Rotaria magnacalcarata TaxID=392030 RepID=A0A815EDJ8_9BILA|nr:unnamed protein product [Rotaria magnacalcarata]CAF1384079.1 unnamed protein product [Rotaria magnacalcarata]CAF2038741.1 unnamed protein product [Rotaria magnacalcarata]CAF2087472.1 unnamed protein product [Rotaria magnacalcarata]CAF2134901.1 unnamed protein product [Rotaria magnacalcarata]